MNFEHERRILHETIEDGSSESVARQMEVTKLWEIAKEGHDANRDDNSVECELGEGDLFRD